MAFHPPSVKLLPSADWTSHKIMWEPWKPQNVILILYYLQSDKVWWDQTVCMSVKPTPCRCRERRSVLFSSRWKVAADAKFETSPISLLLSVSDVCAADGKAKLSELQLLPNIFQVKQHGNGLTLFPAGLNCLLMLTGCCWGPKHGWIRRHYRKDKLEQMWVFVRLVLVDLFDRTFLLSLRTWNGGRGRCRGSQKWRQHWSGTGAPPW